MRDFSAISKRLRRYSENCVAYKLDADFANAVTDAADAIEELVAELVAIRNQLPTWISVDERLPEEHVDVLICTEDYGKNVLGFATDAVWDGDNFLSAWNRASAIHCVTHWMLLPAPPKEET